MSTESAAPRAATARSTAKVPHICLIIIILDVLHALSVTPKAAFPWSRSRDLGEQGMDILGAGLANLASIMIFALVAAGVAKVFQIATTLSEMKELLGDIKRNTDSHI